MSDSQDVGTTQKQAVGWYCHVPFCDAKCGYCDFYSLPPSAGLVDEFVEAATEELSLRDPGRRVESIFVGGGTPTVLPYTALDRLLRELSRRAGEIAEFTIEANPASADELKLDLLRRRGVNRLSLGGQSFHDAELTLLGRRHDAATIIRSVAAARTAGFDNIGLDLIYAMPGQTLPHWRDSLRRAIDLGIEHLSCYALTYEPGTPMTQLRHQGKLAPCDEEIEAEMFEAAADELAAAGFEHYEISNFARPGRRCRANLIYWLNHEYLGIGPSAVLYLDGVRRKNVPDVRRYVEYIRTDPTKLVVEEERLSPEHRARETAVQMLRLTEGLSLQGYQRQTGYDARRLFSEEIQMLATDGLLENTATSLRLTRRGMLLANRVFRELLPAAAKGE